MRLTSVHYGRWQAAHNDKFLMNLANTFFWLWFRSKVVALALHFQQEILIQLFTEGCLLSVRRTLHMPVADCFDAVQLQSVECTTMWLTLERNQLRWLNTLKIQHFAVQCHSSADCYIRRAQARITSANQLLAYKHLTFLIGLVEIGFHRLCLFSRWVSAVCARARACKRNSPDVNESLAGKFAVHRTFRIVCAVRCVAAVRRQRQTVDGTAIALRFRITYLWKAFSFWFLFRSKRAINIVWTRTGCLRASLCNAVPTKSEHCNIEDMSVWVAFQRFWIFKWFPESCHFPFILLFERNVQLS